MVALVADVLLVTTGADPIGWGIFDGAATVIWAATMAWVLVSK